MFVCFFFYSMFCSYSGRTSPQQGNKSFNRNGGSSGSNGIHNGNTAGRNNINNRTNGGGYIDNQLYTPPDRFLSRAHLIELKGAPDALLCGDSKWDQLSQMVWEKFMGAQQTEDTYKKKMYLWRYLYLCVKVSLRLFFFCL